MKQRIWIVGIAVLIITVAGVGLLIQTYRHAPLQQASGRTCIGCVTWFWNGTANVRANRLSGNYRFTGDASYLVTFTDGSVRLANRSLTPGCHVGRASDGDALVIEDGRHLRLRVPAPEEGCSGDETSGA